jgi:hypothetical protein
MNSDQKSISCDPQQSMTTITTRGCRLIPGPIGPPMIAKANADDSRGTSSLVEYSHAESGPSPPTHVHRHHEEAFYVLDGQLTLTVDDEVVAWTARGGCRNAPAPGPLTADRSHRPVHFLLISSRPMDECSPRRGDGLTMAMVGRPLRARRSSLICCQSIFVDLPDADTAALRNERDGCQRRPLAQRRSDQAEDIS